MSVKPPRRRRRGLWFAVIAATVIGLGIFRASGETQSRQRGRESLTIVKTPDRLQLAVAILAIATAAIGFGLFGVETEIGSLVKEPGYTQGMQVAKIVGMVTSGVFYFRVLLSVARILPDNKATGHQLVQGPVQWFYMEMVSLGGLFLLKVAEELASAQ